METSLIQKKKFFIIDFDSTLAKVESLDLLCEISLEGRPDKDECLRQVQEITNLGMEGKINFSESLTKRLSILKANKRHVPELVERLKNNISDSFNRNKIFFEAHSEQVYILSSGFKEVIVPVVAELGIKAENVLANSFEYDEEGNIIGCDKENPLAGDKGKVATLKKLNLKGEVLIIGDGYTDYEPKGAGLSSKFYAFTENVRRQSVIELADHIIPTLDEFLFLENLPRAQSYPKSRMTVLLLENIHPEAIRLFKEEGYNVEFVKGALDEDELCERIKDVSILGIRSKTMVTAKVLEHANKLISVGAFCIGTNQIDLKACTTKGIAVFNAPYSNTRSVVELTIGSIIMLSRNIIQKSNWMHEGKWDKSATGSVEVRGKKLGLIGYGNIGTQLSVLAEAMGMEVYYYDVVEKLQLGNAKKCKSLIELLSIADFLSLHVDGRASNKDMIGEAEFHAMKDGVIFLNMSRGHVVNIPALVKAIKSGKVRGCAIDVFPYEPKTNNEEFINELRGLENVILTPHIGGSTEEAQFNIGQFVPNRMTEYVNSGTSYGSVNFPQIQLPELKEAHRLMHVHNNVPGILANINQILAKHNINILGQYLKTNEAIGYVITDIENDVRHSEELVKDLKNIPGTIRHRMLY
ncbi:MAG TPA: phosphoglycerate dehydrogenase [Cytophagales bacterium]|nr:phosphoglycerate dehydrogenase [Cytophagales bacterium]